MGSHRAERRRMAWKPGPVVAALVGVGAIATTASGSMNLGAGQAAAVAYRATSSAGTAVTGGNGASSVAGSDVSGSETPPRGSERSAMTDRVAAISRDTDRMALADAAQQRLQRAAEVQATQRNAKLTSLARSAEKQAAKIELNQWSLPVAAGAYQLTARFGMAGGLWSSNHTGLDFAAPIGTPILAVASGRITETGWAGAYGNRTIERLPDGTVLFYCHQNAIQVRVGQNVTAGQQIGQVGNTGNTTGAHVHLEVRPGGGDPVDPYTALIYHGLHP